jgi:hypothetical protein
VKRGVAIGRDVIQSTVIIGIPQDAQQAIDAGELAKADALLADVETEQRRALDRFAVNAYLGQEASALYQQGDEFGDNGALLSAIERFKRLVELTPRERAPFSWASNQNQLDTLARLGAKAGRRSSKRLSPPIARR